MRKLTTNIDDELELLTTIDEYRDRVIDLEQSLKDALARIAELDREIETTDTAICMLDEYDRWFRDGSIFVLTIDQVKNAWNNSGTKHETGKLLIDYRKELK